MSWAICEPELVVDWPATVLGGKLLLSELFCDLNPVPRLGFRYLNGVTVLFPPGLEEIHPFRARRRDLALALRDHFLDGIEPFLVGWFGLSRGSERERQKQPT